MKQFFSAALVVAAAFSVQAEANPTSTNALPAALATNATNPEAAMTALFGDPVIAKGDGFEIKRSELDRVMNGLKSAAAARGQAISPDQLSLAQVQMLHRLIQIQLLLQKATDADKAAGKKKTDDQFTALIEHAGSPELFAQQLKSVGITTDQLRATATQENTAMAVLQRQLGVSVTDVEAKNFYDSNPEEFEVPETVKIQDILLLTIDPTTRAPLSDDLQKAKRKQIDDLLKRARAGEDFSALATQYSEDPQSKDNAGNLPPVSRDQMGPELSAAAFAMDTNAISDVITTEYGYYIIKLLGKSPAKKLDYASYADKIKDALVNQKTDKLAPPYLDKLEKDGNVQILDADLKAAIDALSAAQTNTPPAMP